jgi:hypothetical protein
VLWNSSDVLPSSRPSASRTMDEPPAKPVVTERITRFFPSLITFFFSILCPPVMKYTEATGVFVSCKWLKGHRLRDGTADCSFIDRDRQRNRPVPTSKVFWTQPHIRSSLSGSRSVTPLLVPTRWAAKGSLCMKAFTVHAGNQPLLRQRRCFRLVF